MSRPPARFISGATLHAASHAGHFALAARRAGAGQAAKDGVYVLTGVSHPARAAASAALAQEFGLSLVRVDLGRIVSSYIGETEKNLARIFASADAGRAALFFDEADALFGKRTDVRDSHDRYASQATAFLLQKLDAWRGVALIATQGAPPPVKLMRKRVIPVRWPP